MAIVVVTGEIQPEQFELASEVLKGIGTRSLYTDCGGWDVLSGKQPWLLQVLDKCCPHYLHWTLDGNLHIGNPTNNIVEARWEPDERKYLAFGETAKILAELALSNAVCLWYRQVRVRVEDLTVLNFCSRKPCIHSYGPETTPLGQRLRDEGGKVVTPYLGW